jgi:pilus assembly protein CpaB
MRAKPLVTTVFVLSLAGAAVAVMEMMPQKGDATPPPPKEYVLAATTALPVGTFLRAQDVTWQPVTVTAPDQIMRPSEPALAISPDLDEQTRAKIYGAVLRHPFSAGEPISREAIVKPGERDFLQVVLTPGARAIAIPVATGGASTGLLSPGDHVDVILTQDFKDNNTPITRRAVGETVVENLRVLAIDAPEAKGNFGRTVTLEVTSEQAELVNVAAELGKLSVTLRSATMVANGSERVRPKWAGDVSPALYRAGADKPLPVTPPPPIQVMRGTRGQETVNPNP